MDRIFIFLLCFYCCSAKIKIDDLKVPDAVENGLVDDVILDCDFHTEGEEEKGIEVKWYLNGDDVIYQWIPGNRSQGQAFKKFSDNVDTNYKVSNDPDTMYRALHLINISTKLSGNYSCKVSGYNSEHKLTKSMIIYEPADSGLHVEVNDTESIIVCSAEGLYPRPEMTLFISNENETEVYVDEYELDYIEGEDGLYNVSAILYYNPENLTNTFYYICELYIPGTSYELKEKRSYSLEPEDIETKVDGTYEIFDNATNSTENTSEEMQEYTLNATSSSDISSNGEVDVNGNDDEIDIDDKDNKEDGDKEQHDHHIDYDGSASFKHLPNISLYPTLLLILMLSQFQLIL